MATIDLQVSAADSDAHELDDGTGFNRAAVTFRVHASTSASGRYNGGAHFSTVNIPKKYATIDVVHCSVVFPVTARDSPELDIYFNDVDDADDFLATADVTSRAKTSASTSWSDTDLGAGSFVDTPSLIAAAQEVFDRAGWVEGNDMVVLFEGKNLTPAEDARFTPYDLSTVNAVKLHFEYTPAVVKDAIGQGIIPFAR